LYLDRVPLSNSALIKSTIPPSPLSITTDCFLPLLALADSTDRANSFTDSALLVLTILYLESVNPIALRRGCSTSSKKSGARPVPESVDMRTCRSFLSGSKCLGRDWYRYLLSKSCGRLVAEVLRSSKGGFPDSAGESIGARLHIMCPILLPSMSVTMMISSSLSFPPLQVKDPSRYTTCSGSSAICP
jgi:hypothetical protein